MEKIDTTIIHDERFLKQLKRHEGTRKNKDGLHCAYVCPAGKLTIGYGHNLEANPVDWLGNRRTINDAEAEKLLQSDLYRMLPKVADIVGSKAWAKLDLPRQGVMLNMAFNVGLRGFAGFRRMLGCVRTGDYQRAADEMLDSAWVKQVKSRAYELARQMQTGEWQG